MAQFPKIEVVVNSIEEFGDVMGDHECFKSEDGNGRTAYSWKKILVKALAWDDPFPLTIRTWEGFKFTEGATKESVPVWVYKRLVQEYVEENQKWVLEELSKEFEKRNMKAVVIGVSPSGTFSYSKIRKIGNSEMEKLRKAAMAVVMSCEEHIDGKQKKEEEEDGPDTSSVESFFKSL